MNNSNVEETIREFEIRNDGSYYALYYIIETSSSSSCTTQRDKR